MPVGRMKLDYFLSLPVGDPKYCMVGERYRDKRDREYKIGEVTYYWEIIRVTERGYEAMPKDIVLI